MDNEFQQMPSTKITTLCRKSWTAYVKVVLAGTLAVAVLIAVLVVIHKAAANDNSAGLGFFMLAAYAALLLAICVTAFRVVSLRAYHLYYDDTGVWLYRGILPWKRGRLGVLWRDMDTANFFPSFFSWLLRSYKIRVGHRFTRESEIILTSMSRGDKAVGVINNIHQDMARANKLN